MKLLILILTLLSSYAWSIPEDVFESEWKQKALPYFQNLEVGTLTNKEGLTFKYYFLAPHPEGKTLVIVPGRTEPSIKYAELIYDLRNSGLNIFILDHQGQGASQRSLKDSHKGHVVKFNHYVQDFEQFMSQVVLKRSSKDLYLIAHSMGGAISVHYLARHPGVFTKAALMAPMLKINTDPYSETVARYYSKLLVTIGKGDEYAPDRGPYIPDQDRFEVNTVTQSEVRFNASKYLFVRYPYLAVGGPTTRWIHEALKATKKIHKLPIKTPTLLFQAGLDEVVMPERQLDFCLESFCTLEHIPGAKHELLMEADEIRNEVIQKIESFFGIQFFPENGESIVGN